MGPHGGNNIEKIETMVENKFVEVVMVQPTHLLMAETTNWSRVGVSNGLTELFFQDKAFIVSHHSALVDAD